MDNWQMNPKLIPPMTLSRSVLFFAIPLLILTAIFWGLIPIFDLMGVRLFNTVILTLGLSMVILLLFSIRFYRKEGHPWNWSEFRGRFRLARMNGIDWVWTMALAAFWLGSRHALSFTSNQISEIVEEPKFLIRMLAEDPNYFMEIPMSGNWLLFAGILLLILVSVVSLELWLRGYILPRQQLIHGRATWLVHGLLSTLLYLFLPWQVLRELPGALAVAYVAQVRQNTWPGIIAHFVAYTPLLSPIFSRAIE